MKFSKYIYGLPFLWLFINCSSGNSEVQNNDPSNSAAEELTGKYDKLVLHNGIQLPEIWPPDYGMWQGLKSMPLPYLENPPSVIPINTGRQLFVDNFLIESTDLIRVHHQPKYHDDPVLEPTEEWEHNNNGPYAAPFSDGIWYDELDNNYKMWYLTGAGPDKRGFRTAYAESEDGIYWKKPNLDLYGNTNIIDTTNRDASTVWLDKVETDPSKRFKMFAIEARQENLWPMILKYSPDGLNWTKGVAQSGGMEDRTTAFYNPFLSKWVLSMKSNTAIGRSRSYLEHPDVETAVSLMHKVQFDDNVDDSNIVFWFGADPEDPRHPKFPDIEPQIYNHDAIAYESLMLGFFTVWQGPINDVAEELDIQKRNEVLVGYSRDGFHWDRPSHKAFMGVNESEGAWNWGNVQSIVGNPIINGDSLYFYVSGRRLSDYMWDSYTSTGLASLRRDGFVSLTSDTSGSLLTRDLSFDGKYLFVNADVTGELKVEVLDQDGDVIKGYSNEESIPLKGDSTEHRITWKNEKTLADLKNKPVKFRFYLTDGEIYSFWVSPWETGESRGYTAGGGPGLHPSGTDLPYKNNSK